jgi:hypothetical protein
MTFTAPEMITIPVIIRDAKLCRRFGKTPEGKTRIRKFVAEMRAAETFLETNLATAREAIQLGLAALGGETHG